MGEYLLTQSLHGAVLPENLKRPKLLKKFPAFYATRRFITVFTRARHLSLSWARLIRSMPPHPTSRRSILILSSGGRIFKMDIREMEWGDMESIDVAQDRDWWRALVNAVMNLRVPWSAGNFLTGWGTVSFSVRPLLHAVSKYIFRRSFILVLSTKSTINRRLTGGHTFFRRCPLGRLLLLLLSLSFGLNGNKQVYMRQQKPHLNWLDMIIQRESTTLNATHVVTWRTVIPALHSAPLSSCATQKWSHSPQHDHALTACSSLYVALPTNFL